MRDKAQLLMAGHLMTSFYIARNAAANDAIRDGHAWNELGSEVLALVAAGHREGMAKAFEESAMLAAGSMCLACAHQIRRHATARTSIRSERTGNPPADPAGEKPQA